MRTRALLWWGSCGAIVTLLAKVLVSNVTLSWGTKTITAGPMDAGVIAALLTPLLGALVAHGHKALGPKEPDHE